MEDVKRQNVDWSFNDLANPFGTMSGPDGVSPEGGPALESMHRGEKVQKAQINAAHNEPLGKPTSPMVMQELKKKRGK